MRADKVLRAILDKEGVSTIQASVTMGKSKGYVSAILSTKAMPKTDTMAKVCDALGYDLIARSREDGYEFTIDPPE